MQAPRAIHIWDFYCHFARRPDMWIIARIGRAPGVPASIEAQLARQADPVCTLSTLYHHGRELWRGGTKPLSACAGEAVAPASDYRGRMFRSHSFRRADG